MSLIKSSRHAQFPAVIRPFVSFFSTEAAGGIVLLGCTVIALIWANSAYADSYFKLWEMKLTVGTESFSISKTLGHWVNDGLMAIFFFVVGLEIKREVLVGELSSVKGAALPLLAALGGMVVPAGIYFLIALGFGNAEARRGWAVPMATDIAFALGVLALLGKRAPAGLKIFLTALAIADDLGAVGVIAFFFTARLSLVALGWAGLFFVALIWCNRFGVRRSLVYMVLGMGLWVAVLKSGVHATVAGVLLAMTIPARRRIDEATFLAEARRQLERFAIGVKAGEDDPSPAQRRAVQGLESACEAITQPLNRIEHALHPWVAFGIMPIFALANAGVSLGGSGAGLKSAVGMGTFLGLFLGKQLGVFAFAWGAVRMGWARLPVGVSWRQLYGVACLCGIGFTMSLFIAQLAFNHAGTLDSAKLSVLVASGVSAIVGATILVVTHSTGRKGGDRDGAGVQQVATDG